ncbi:MAG: translation initiation factor IF-2 N-terminal domain-containing protein, partial [Bdellovibrionales bacterium]|nr:translation initiation factor IF-2 N-terminal domain-containing protein [Bdellovibrionales bacterium]
MSKTRVYELAKELGLENKRVLELCTELGIDGKTSHSNSLSDDEADRIRRSVIRQAVSGNQRGSKEILIDGEPGVEQRRGNVIRRRRRTSDEEAEAEAESSWTGGSMDARPRADFAPSSPDLRGERDARAQALAAADALFRKADAETAEQAEPIVEAESAEQPEVEAAV